MDSVESRYLSDASFRRRAMLDSLVAPANGYSRLRALHYASGDALDWESLPEWNPATEPLTLDEAAPRRALSPDARALDLADPALGAQAFFRYPIQLLADAPATTADYGLWRDPARGLGGVVRFALADGSTGFALTCSSCHARPDAEGAIDPGRPNSALDLGRLLFDQSVGKDAALLGWGPGRLDVTTGEGLEPVRIADLRPVRWLTHLHADATVAQRDVVSLAMRIETLAITARHGLLRPPRPVALALARYVWALADRAPPIATSGRGAAIFGARCASCHVPPALTGPPVDLARIGTDPTLGLSADRGTGTYRVPSLRFVSSRGPLLHDASLPSLDALFDPARLAEGFTGGSHGVGAVRGHEAGLDLDERDRAALLSFLRTL